VVTLMGLLALPAMLKARYDEKLSSRRDLRRRLLGILIPPSIMLIVYAPPRASRSCGSMPRRCFPGLMLAGLYVVYVIGRAVAEPEAGAPRRGGPGTCRSSRIG
jgi:TRAP-type mannitol/chloroaromatic compound transport system permease large subunit